MRLARESWRVALAAVALCAMAPGARAVAPTLVVASTLTPDTMYAGFLLPVTSKEFLATAGLVFNNVPYMKDYYGPLEEWLPRARTWSLQSPKAINPPFKVPPGPDAVHVSSPFSQIVAFGDSMSDTGNLFRFTQAVGGLGMPMAPSNHGRFSNGVVALEVLANQLQLPLTNYCFSGGHSGKGNLLPFWSWQKGMLFQIDEYHRTLQARGETRNDPDALYFLWAGPNDHFTGLSMYTSQTGRTMAANYLKALRAMHARGSRHFFIPLMPDLSLTPQSSAFDKEDSSYRDQARRRSDEGRTEMLKVIGQARAELPGIDIKVFDTLAYMREQYVKIQAEGYNVTESCYSSKSVGGKMVKTVCADPDKYLFWDKNHPTDWASRVLGSEFTKAAVAP